MGYFIDKIPGGNERRDFFYAEERLYRGAA